MEGSKTFSKDFMARWEIPTAKYRNFSDYELAKAYLDSVSYKVVLKASGLGTYSEPPFVFSLPFSYCRDVSWAQLAQELCTTAPRHPKMDN